jgi:AraC-like DNA-binding protein
MYRYLLQDSVKPGSHLAVSTRRLMKPIGVHWHDYIELELTVDGSGSQNLNGQKTALKRGSLCLMRLADFHELIPQPELRLMNLSVDESILSGELLKQLTLGNSLMFQLGEGETQTMESLLTLIMKENAGQNPDTDYLKHLLSCILLRILRLVPKEEGLAPMEETPIHAARLYLHMHFRENPSLSRLAQIAHYNTSHFSATFHKETGMTYTQYLNMLKTDYAKKLLLSTKLKITEICSECGFASHSNFLRLFRQETGMSPAAYRKNCGRI